MSSGGKKNNNFYRGRGKWGWKYRGGRGFYNPGKGRGFLKKNIDDTEGKNSFQYFIEFQ